MNLEKAIEILDLYEHAASSIPRDDFLDALKLGIAALRFTLNLRHVAYPATLFKPPMLPGEDDTQCLNS